MNRFLLLLLLVQTTTKNYAQSADTIAIDNVNVITMLSEDILANQRVLVADGRIVKIESALLPCLHSITQTIDGTNKYLLPGLAEMHYHLMG